jgi:L-ascorbate metabolism protein UlaG (beta-lactamase superfamily)
MKLTYLAHSTFLIEADDGSRLVTDPVDKGSGYDLHGVEADVVTISHHHFDHDAVEEQVTGNPAVVDTVGAFAEKGFVIVGYPSFHDEVQGAKRGPNVLYKIEADGKTVVHLGDLGHDLDEGTVKELKDADALLIPVGGTFTIDAKQAAELAAKLEPKCVIPMHYKTEQLTFEIAPLDPFLKKAKKLPVKALKMGESMTL